MGQMAHLEGMQFLWNVALTCSHTEVCHLAMHKLMDLFQHAVDPQATSVLIK